jgi:hypothetical protein
MTEGGGMRREAFPEPPEQDREAECLRTKSQAQPACG